MLSWLPHAYLAVFTSTFCRRAIVTRKVGQTDLVFSVRSGFISRSVHATLEVCVQRLRFVPPWLTDRRLRPHRHTSTHTAF